MKKELPPYLVWVLVGVGVLALGAVFYFAGGTGQATAADRAQWEAEAEAATQRNQGAFPSSQNNQVPQTAPGLVNSEYEARQRASQ